MRMLELSWWGLALIVIATIFIYTFVFLLTLKGIMKGQKGRFLYNLSIAPFSVKSRIYAIQKQLGVEESDVKYIGNNVYKVNGNRYVVEGFFGVAVFNADEKGNKLTVNDNTVMKYSMPNLRHGSGEADGDKAMKGKTKG